MKKGKKNKLSIQGKLALPKREADLIVEYLCNPATTKNLPANLKKNLDRYHLIHGMLLEYKQHSAIIGTLKEFHGRNEKQARYDINEAQYIFGKAIHIEYAYERAYLLELSRKNLEIAFTTKDTKKISLALKTHREILGEEIDLSDVPDFSMLQANTYNLVLPKGLAEQMQDILKRGAVNLSDIIPANHFTFPDAEDAEIIEE